jgi:hypothetical protein
VSCNIHNINIYFKGSYLSPIKMSSHVPSAAPHNRLNPSTICHYTNSKLCTVATIQTKPSLFLKLFHNSMETLNCVERTETPCASYTMVLHTITTSHSRNSEVPRPPKHTQSIAARFIWTNNERMWKVKLRKFKRTSILINSLGVRLFLNYEISLTADVIGCTLLWTFYHDC